MSALSRAKGALIHAYLHAGPPVRVAHAIRRRTIGASRRLTFWHRVDDPWSHLLAQALPRLLDAFPALMPELRLVSGPGPDLDAAPALRVAHARRDARALVAEHPSLTLPETLVEPSADAIRLANAILLARTGRDGIEVATRVGHALLGGDDDALAALAEEYGAVNLDTVSTAIDSADRGQRRAGHYQGAMLDFGGEWYSGVDRLGRLARRLAEEHGGDPSAALPPSAPLPEGEPVGRLELFFSFRSPYSYVGLHRALSRYPEGGAVDVVLRPVLPMVSRGLAVPSIKRLYLARDAYREARTHEVPFGAICDPLGEGVERCLRLFHEAPEANRRRVALEAGRMIWSEAKDLTTAAGYGELVERAGLDEDTGARALADDGWADLAEENRRAMTEELGLWGVPSFRVGERAAWGQDRLDRVHRWLCEDG